MTKQPRSHARASACPNLVRMAEPPSAARVRALSRAVLADRALMLAILFLWLVPEHPAQATSSVATASVTSEGNWIVADLLKDLLDEGIRTIKRATSKPPAEPSAGPENETASTTGGKLDDYRAAVPGDLSQRTNILAAKNGCQIMYTTTSSNWSRVHDDDLKSWDYVGDSEAVFAFRDEKPAVFDTVRVYVPEQKESNIKDFELLVGNDAAFTSVGRFRVKNERVSIKDPYQTFQFPPVKARYLKLRAISAWASTSVIVFEFQVLGTVLSE